MLKSSTRSTCGQMRLNNVALCHVHKAILNKLDIKKLMQEFVVRKDNCRSLFGKYFNLILIIHNVLLKWFDEWQKVNNKPSKWRDGSRNGVVVEVGRGALGSLANTI